MLNKVKNKKYFSKGKRSKIYIGNLNKKKVIIKEEIKVDAINVIKKEASWLRLLNKYKIGPKLIYEGDNYLIMEFIDGDRIIDFFGKGDNINIKKVIRGVLSQCRILDKLQINKKEMNNPYKHIIIKKDKVYFIDFERCKKTINPKNITQFFDFLLSKKIKDLINLDLERKEVVKVLKSYKKSYSEKDYKKVLNLLR